MVRSQSITVNVSGPPLSLSVKAVDVKSGKELKILFVFDSLARKTPYSAKVTEGTSLTFRFPKTISGLNFVKWEDESTNPERAITVSADMEIIAYYESVMVSVVGLIVIVIGVGGLIYLATAGG